jgi:hypothetical protein
LSKTRDMPPPTARCTRCGRSFIFISEKSDMIDHYKPFRDSGVEPNELGECGGRIARVLKDLSKGEKP